MQSRKTFSPEERKARLKVLGRVEAMAEQLEFAEQKPYVELSIALATLGDFDGACGSRAGSARARSSIRT